MADQSGGEWVVLCSPARRRLLSFVNQRLLSASLPPSVTDEYKMKGVEKVKYMSGDEGGVDGQDSTVRDSIPHFVFYYTPVMGTFLCYDGFSLSVETVRL